MSFHVVTPRNFDNVYKTLVDSLGIRKLKAVGSASGGAIQAMEWAAAYPEFVERIIHVIGAGLAVQPCVIGLLDIWSEPIKLDSRWNNGDYYGRDEPIDGLAQALKAVTITTLHFDWAERDHSYKSAVADRNPFRATPSDTTPSAYFRRNQKSGQYCVLQDRTGPFIRDKEDL